MFMRLEMVATEHRKRLMGWFARSVSVLVATLTTGCVATFPGQSSGIITFADTVSDFDVVPPGWITPDGSARGAYTLGKDDKALAFIFPSLLLDHQASRALHVSIPDFLGGSSGFRSGTFVHAPGADAQRAIEIATARSGSAIVIDIDASSMSQILRLHLDQFRKLQAAYVGWLFSQCGDLYDCFSPKAAESLRAFWKNDVLREASFQKFAAQNLNPPAPMKLEAFESVMFATRIAPRQQLSITWGNNNFYPDTIGGTPILGTSYSRTTSGGNTRLQILADAGTTRLYPAENCDGLDIPRIRPAEAPRAAMLPYPSDFPTLLFQNWVMPVYNLFDLHNSYLLTAPKEPQKDPPVCRKRDTPRHLFLLTPSIYVKPDSRGSISQFETEASIGIQGDHPDPDEDYLLLARQFVILACDQEDQDSVKDEWGRVLKAAQRKGGDRGKCGKYLHGVFSAKTFVELRNRFTLDGRVLEDGVVHFTGIGQAVGPSLGSRLNAEAAPESKPLLQLLRAVPAESPNPRRVLLRFYTTMSDVLDQAAVLEGDDIHAISVPEILR